MAPKSPPTVPVELTALLERNARARAAFHALPPSHQREWTEHVAEAKRAATRERRAHRCIDELTATA